MDLVTPSQAESGQYATSDLDAAAELRSRTWNLIASLLRWPRDPDLLPQIGRAEGTGEDGEADELARAWGDLANAARAADPVRLDDEYHDLFIGLGRGELVPYASWYLTGFLMDRPLVTLRRDLALLGFERQPDVHEPEDHAGALADVMAMLADPAEGQDESTQWLFFREHIDSWMPNFFNDLQTAASADFYRAVGRFGSAFLDFERAWLQANDTIASAQAGGTGQSRRPSR